MPKTKTNITTSGEFSRLTDTERLKRDIYRPDMEKLQLFTKMLRTGMLLKKAVISHK